MLSTAQPATSAGLPNSQPSGPRIAFQTTLFDFGKAAAGELAKHTYYFTNTGTERLVLSGVHPSCGCTAAADWTREVEPGGFGQIPIQLSTTSFNGPISKSITVASNDKLQPTVFLQIRGTVWKPIEITPAYAVLNLQPYMTGGSVVVSITNNLDEPVHFYNAEVNNPALAVTLKTNLPGKAYQVELAAVPPLKPGSASGQITLRSTWTNKPVETITAWLNVQPPVTVVPAMVNLAPAPLPNPASPVITIINNTTNPFALSNPRVSVPGVDVQVKELQAGRYLTVTLGFPAGFGAPQGAPLEFTAETTNPLHPVIKVPIRQSPSAAQNYIPVPAPIAPPQAAAPRVVTPRSARAAPPMLPPAPTSPSR